MGFFSGVRRRIKKLIPKEVRPFIPYAAAMIPGLQAMGPLSGIGSMAARKALIAGGTKFLTDDQADLKDVGITAALAAAPSALSKFGTPATTAPGENKTIMDSIRGGASKLGQMAADKPFTTLATQGGIDAGIKAAELNEDALAKYNADLARQGINDKAGRRSAIRAIYANTGTWDMDEVDNMLDTYGYRTGGRVGYAEGDMVLPMPSQISPERQNQIEGSQIAEQAYNEIMQKFMNKFPGLATGEETLEEMVAMLQAEDVMDTENLGILGLDRSMDMITPESAKRSARRIMRGDTRFGSPEFNMGGRVNYKKGGMTNEEYENFQDMLETAQGGLASLEDDEEFLPIRELRLREGGSVDDALMERVKELQDEGLDFASAMAQAMKESQSSKKARGGIMDVNENINMNIPGVGNENIDVNSMESIRGQTAGPQWYYDRIQALEFEFGDELTDEEIAEIAYDSDKFYDKMGYDPAEYKKGGRVNRAGGGMMMASADMDIPIQDLAEDFEITFGRPAESIEELKDYYRKKYEFNGDTSSSENNGIGRMASAPDAMDERNQVMEMMAQKQFNKSLNELSDDEIIQIEMMIKEMSKKQVAPERMMAAEGGLMNLGGREMDLRGGGFVPMGKAERADDVPARLSKNEFVMTADAVRAAGGGSVQKGADLMYDQMKQLESQA